MDNYSNNAVLQTWENQQTPENDKRLEDTLCPQASGSFSLSLISWIMAWGSDEMLANCFSALADNLSDPEILSSFTAAVESMK